MTAEQDERAEALASARAHILEALDVALAEPHRVLDVILDSEDADDAVRRLETELGFSDVQARQVMDPQFRRVSRHDQSRVREGLAHVRDVLTELGT